MILSYQTIKKLHILTPCLERHTVHGMTGGLGPAGYDITVEFDKEGQCKLYYLVPDQKVNLMSSIERFQMPLNVLGRVCDKSSWARQGLFVQNTVIEPGWSGYLTLEITNHGNGIIELWRGMPIAQVVFEFLDEETQIPYRGKYDNQMRGPVAAK